MYRLVASDMDETFLDAEHKVPEVNVRAVRRMRELGVLFVPSSGRPYASIMESIRELDPKLMEGSYVISFNGGFINRYGDPKPLLTCSLNRELAEELYALGREHGNCMHVYAPDGLIYVCNLPESERRYLSTLSGIVYFDPADEKDLSFLGDDVVKLLYMSDDFSGLRELGAQLKPEVAAKGGSVTYSSSRYLEFMPAGVNKGTGLLHLAKMLGIPQEETIGVGDASNDAQMIELAGLGVGVANVTDDVRPLCDAVLDTRSDQGAFGELVERFLEPGEGAGETA